MSRALAIVKPWFLDDYQEILTSLDEYGQRIGTVKTFKIPRIIWRIHYEARKDEPWFNGMLHDISAKPVVLALYAGNYKVLDQVKDGIRESCGIVTPEGFSHQRNALHLSSNEPEFLREMDLWHGYLNNGFKF